MSASPRSASNPVASPQGGGFEHDAPSFGRNSRLQDLTDAVGAEAAAKLVAEFGGRRVYVPQTPAKGDLLARSIGLAAENRLSRIYGGDRLDIPADLNRVCRRTRIFALRSEGLSVSAIARDLRCTERYVYKVLAAIRTG